MADLDKIKKAFGSDAELMVFEEQGDGVLVRGKAFLPDKVWRSLSKVVEQELGGKYSSVERGWVIPKSPESRETPTALPEI